MKEENIIDSNALVKIFSKRKNIFFSIPILLFIFTYLLSFAFPNKFTSKALLTQNSLIVDQQMENIESLAAIAGINIGSQSENGGISLFEVIETIKSKDFFFGLLDESEDFFDYFLDNHRDGEAIKLNYPLLKEDLLEDQIYQEKIINKFLRESHYFYVNNFLSISIDKESKLITIEVESKSPTFSKKSLEKIIFQVNEKMKKRTLELSERSINHLQNLILNNKALSISKNLNARLAKEIEKRMLASVQDNFVLVTIDSPSISLKPSAPRKLFLSLLVFTFSIIFLVVLFCFDYLSKRQKYEN
tara:strand:+ start:1862 stop:2770 length:909 start_codon:yes stop_codon:yes gene_type:complete